jgi:pimeloyl-ACP methyl ester carboxylesterase
MSAISEREHVMTFTTSQVALSTGMLDVHSAGSGRPLVFVHSAGGVRLSPALDTLAQRHHLYLPVLPGFDGTTLHEAVRSMSDLADLVADFIRNEIKDPCDVVGHSFGGWVSAWLAVRHPDLVQQLVLVGAAGFRPEGVGGLAGDPADLRRRMFAHPENLPTEQKPQATQARNREMAHHYHGATSMDQALVARLGEIQALALIVHGTKDGVIPTESARLLKEKIPHSVLIYLYDAAHAMDVDQPARFSTLIDSFLTRGESFIVNWGASQDAA